MKGLLIILFFTQTLSYDKPGTPKFGRPKSVRGGSAVKVSSKVEISEMIVKESAILYIDPSSGDASYSSGSAVEQRYRPENNRTSRRNEELAHDEYRTAMLRTFTTVAAAGVFGLALSAIKGPNTAYEFFASYLVEQSLSIDNLFVFIMLFEYFNIPSHLQKRVLAWGITGAIVLRGLMIGVGVAAIQRFKSVILLFAGILIASSINLLRESFKNHESDNNHKDLSDNPMMKLTKFFFPNTSMDLHGEAFFVKGIDGKRLVTPLFLCLICVELSDFVFAVDSIPAVLGVSKDPLVVYASNIFAIMALRSLYTVINKAVANFMYLKPAVSLVLGFVGCKMIAEYFHIEISTMVSLLVIVSLLTTGIVASLFQQKQNEKQNIDSLSTA